MGREAVVSRSSRIAAQQPLAPPYVLTEIDAPEVAATVRPGQFVMVRPEGSLDPLLARPFSVYGVGASGTIRLLYNVVGRGTALLARLRPGDPVHVVGPLGRGFRLDRLPDRAVLVAGGIGIAAFGLLCGELGRHRVPVKLLYGARTARDLIEVEAFAAHGVELALASDDGSRGRRALVTALLEEEVAAGPGLSAYACGPPAMLRRVRELTLAAGLGCELALEARMACGFGICLGCAIPAAAAPGTYRLVCQDGPVLEAAEVLP
jgi:dihydroorotate dehydrogenase electron transfer subunit